MSRESTPRERLIAQVAVLQFGSAPAEAAWDLGEAFVEALESEPDKQVECPCCEKLVQLCVKHYQLHEPGKPCVICRREA